MCSSMQRCCGLYLTFTERTTCEKGSEMEYLFRRNAHHRLEQLYAQYPSGGSILPVVYFPFFFLFLFLVLLLSLSHVNNNNNIIILAILACSGPFKSPKVTSNCPTVFVPAYVRFINSLTVFVPAYVRFINSLTPGYGVCTCLCTIYCTKQCWFFPCPVIFIGRLNSKCSRCNIAIVRFMKPRPLIGELTQEPG